MSTDMPGRVVVVTALASCAWAACMGTIGGRDSATPGSGGGAEGPGGGSSPGSVPGPAGTAGASSPSACMNRAPTYAVSGLRRLTQEEYQNTLRDVFGAEPYTAAGSSVIVNDSTVVNGFSVEAHAVTEGQVEAFLGAADALSIALTTKPERLAMLSACLAQAQVTDACVQGFIERMGRRLFRRPLRSDETTTFLGVYKEGQALNGSAPEGVRWLLFTLLQWSDFLYRPETGGAPVADATGVYKLTSFELGTRLAYMLWGSTPDEKLLDAAANGTLDKEAGLEAGLAAEVDRLLGEPKAQAWAQRFFQQWLRLDGIPSPGQSDKFLAGLSRTSLVDEARRELERFFLLQAFGGGGYKDLMTSPASFISAATPNLGKIYEIAAAPGDGKVELPKDRRGGLLTRAGILMSANVQTPIPHRGDLVANHLLCSPVPPPNVAPEKIKPPDAEATKTARQGWDALIMRQPECAGCHGILNPLAYALENYDALGRYRTMEPIVDSKGAEIARLPIDAVVNVAWPDGSPATRVNGAVELGAGIAQNKGAQKCFARQWLQFEMARKVAPEDACLIEDMGTAVSLEGGLKGMFRRLALAPAVRVNRPGRP